MLFRSIQIGALMILFVSICPLLFLTINEGLISTLFIFILVTTLGLWLCWKVSSNLSDRKLKILGLFWLLKIGITLFLLYFGWIPQLDPSSDSWGYDPQRFYVDSMSLVENNWQPLSALNYQGIVYFYGVFFYLFGQNPVLPALINAFITLLGSLFLIKTAYSFVLVRTNKDWLIAGILLIPEILWYDVMTSRENLMAVLIIFVVFSVARFFHTSKNLSFIKASLIAIFSLVLILAIRTSIVIPVVISIFCMSFYFPTKNKSTSLIKLMLFAFIGLCIAIGPLIQSFAGGANLDYIAMLESLISFENNVASTFSWSDNSIGLLLKPNSLLEAVLFLPPRMILYIIAPMPDVAISIPELINGSWYFWQKLMIVPTSICMVIGFPFVLAGTAKAWTERSNLPKPLVFYISFWIIFMAVAGGNIIIHERYRVMFTMIMFLCIWWGYTRCQYSSIRFWGVLWFSFLTFFAVFYLVFKGII